MVKKYTILNSQSEFFYWHLQNFLLCEYFYSPTKEELQVHMETISYLELSSEYDTLRQRMIEYEYKEY